MKLLVHGIAPIPGTESFVCSVGNHMEHLTIDQIKEYAARPYVRLEQANPHIGIVSTNNRRAK